MKFEQPKNEELFSLSEYELINSQGEFFTQKAWRNKNTGIIERVVRDHVEGNFREERVYDSQTGKRSLQVIEFEGEVIFFEDSKKLREIVLGENFPGSLHELLTIPDDELLGH